MIKHTRKPRRRERNRLLFYRERMAAIPHSLRIEAKAAAREECLDRIALDKLEGRETGSVARGLHREECRKGAERLALAKAAVDKAHAARKAASRSGTRQGRGPRQWHTYRWAQRMAERGKRMAPILKAERLRTGETRSQMDRRRHAEAQMQGAGA